LEEKNARAKKITTFSRVPIFTVTFNDPVKPGSVKTHPLAYDQFVYDKIGKWPWELELIEKGKEKIK
jgi:hypothetical protein